jgi:hypothetical protein
MNRKFNFVVIVLISSNFLSAMDQARFKRNKKIAQSTLEGRLRLNKEWVTQFHSLESWDKKMAIESIDLSKLAIRRNYNLFDPNDPLLTETIGYYNRLIELLKDEGHADEDDFFWELAEPVFVPKQSATIEEIDESDLSQLTQYPPNNSTLLITAPNNQRNQRLYYAIKYSIISGGLTAFTLIVKLYKWIKTKRSTQPEETDLQSTVTNMTGKTESLVSFSKPKTLKKQ